MALISKEDLLTKFETGALLFQPEVKRIIKIQPEVDAVPVVRCKDCKYWNPKHAYCEGVGNWFGMVDEWSENGFCYKGERRTDETD